MDGVTFYAVGSGAAVAYLVFSSIALVALCRAASVKLPADVSVRLVPRPRPTRSSLHKPRQKALPSHPR
jgi:hypothetical protein